MLNDTLVPGDISQQVSDWFGEEGRTWLARVVGVVAELADRWQLTLGPAYQGGSHALVLRVTQVDGTPAVLKVPYVDDENYAESVALAAYAGDGAVRLYRYDAATNAMLLEIAEPGTELDEHPDLDFAIGTLCRLLRRLRRTPPAGPARRPAAWPQDVWAKLTEHGRQAGHPFPVAHELAARWVELFPEIQRRHGDPLPATLVREACELAAERTVPDGPELLLNRDGHLLNVLAAEREPWLLIDPKPVVGEAAFEGGWPVLYLLDETPTRAAADSLVRRIADGLGVDAERVRGWAFLRAMDNALDDLDSGEDYAESLAQAESLSRSAS